MACIAVPSLDERLLEAKRGVTADEALVAGSAQVFALKENLDESARQELAWATFGKFHDFHIFQKLFMICFVICRIIYGIVYFLYNYKKIVLIYAFVPRTFFV